MKGREGERWRALLENQQTCYIYNVMYKAGVAVHCKGGQPCWHVHSYAESGENSP